MVSRASLSDFGRLFALSVAIAVAGWVIGYAYLVKIAGYPAAGFFTFKMGIGLFVVSFTVCLVFRLGGFFTKTP